MATEDEQIVSDSKIEIGFGDANKAIKLKNHWVFYDENDSLVITKESPVGKRPDDVQFSAVIS